jgi:hypothetical protein
MKAAWLLLVLALAACANSSSGSGGSNGGRSGIAVRTVVDAGCPVQRAGSPCPVLPVVARVVVLDANNAVAARAMSGRDGEIRISLRPGRYTISAERPDATINPRTRPKTVTVPHGVFVAVKLQFDSGVRTASIR